MIQTAAHYISIVTNPRAHAPVPHRFSKTMQIGRVDGLYRLPPPEKPQFASGTHAHSVLYHLGHPRHAMYPPTHLTPQAFRQLRDHAHHARTPNRKLHIFGILDHKSPYGNRAYLEELLRSLHATNAQVVVHLGTCHPTPSDFHYGMREIKSLCNDRISIGSVFPLDSLHFPLVVHGYANSLNRPKQVDAISDMRFPVQRAYMFTENSVHLEDRLVFATYQFHGLDMLVDALTGLTHEPIHFFSHDVDSDANIERALKKSRHIMAVASRPSYTQAYFGQAPHHPYFESLHHDVPSEVLEMLLSPHFGYTVAPYRTVVLLDEDAKGTDFDWLLANYIKSKRSQPYYCCLIDQTSAEGSLVISNMTIDPRQSLYAQLHHYA